MRSIRGKRIVWIFGTWLLREPVSPIRSIYADSLQAAILVWAAEEVPADLFTRIKQQITFAEQNVMKGYSGLTVVQESLLGEFVLQWDPTAVPSEPAEFRRWVFNMTNKPATERSKAVASTGWKGLELLVEGKMAKTKTKKVYNVSDGQFAFNF